MPILRIIPVSPVTQDVAGDAVQVDVIQVVRSDMRGLTHVSSTTHAGKDSVIVGNDK